MFILCLFCSVCFFFFVFFFFQAEDGIRDAQESRGLGDVYKRQVPNLAVDMDSWARSACYPRGTFYPLSDGASTSHRRITSPDFRPCSRCLSHSQAPLCTYTRNLITNQAEGTFGRLRYFLGGNRPS